MSSYFSLLKDKNIFVQLFFFTERQNMFLHNYFSLLKDKICFCTTIFYYWKTKISLSNYLLYWKTKYVFAQLFFITQRQKCLCPTIFPYLQLKFVLCKTKCKVANFCISEVIFCWRKKRKIKCTKTNFKVHIFCLLHILFCCKKKTKNVFPNVFNNGVSYFFLECMVHLLYSAIVPTFGCWGSALKLVRWCGSCGTVRKKWIISG